MDIKNKVAIITGASSGIGRALAYEMHKNGVKLVLGARNSVILDSMVAEMGKNLAIAVPTDVTIEAECRNLIKVAIETFGRIDILVNNAGISMRAAFEEVEMDVIRRVMDVNFWGTVYCTKYALPHIIATRGSIAGVISIAGYVGLPGRTGYSASKFAVRGFLETVRAENYKKGVYVLIAAPGFTASNIRYTALDSRGEVQGESPRNESGMMSAEKCAHIIFNAIKKRKRTVIMTFIEGKFTVFLSKFFPHLLEKLAYKHMAKEPNSPFK